MTLLFTGFNVDEIWSYFSPKKKESEILKNSHAFNISESLHEISPKIFKIE